MRYRYIRVLVSRGVSVPSGAEDPLRVLTSGVTIFLTADPIPLLIDHNRASALADLMLNAVFRGEHPADRGIHERLVTATEAVCDARRAKYKGGPYLVLVAEGVANNFAPDRLLTTAGFSVCFEAVPEGDISGRWNPCFEAAIVSMALAIEGFDAAEFVESSVVFYSEDNTPVFSYRGGMTVDLEVPTPVTPAICETASRYYRALSERPALARSSALINASLESRGNPFRSFLLAWTSLEVLVNKLFGEYERQYFTSISEGSPGLGHFIGRIRKVMSDKYRLSNKLALILSATVPGEADEILAHFFRLKKLRDRIAHGQLIDDSDLRADEVLALARRCSAAHVDHGLRGLSRPVV